MLGRNIKVVFSTNFLMLSSGVVTSLLSAWALGPRGENSDLRRLRLFNFLEFLGPGGFATPDDQEALENCQRGYTNVREVAWNDISKGMPRQGPPMNDDEEQMRCFWRQWRDRLGALS